MKGKAKPYNNSTTMQGGEKGAKANDRRIFSNLRYTYFRITKTRQPDKGNNVLFSLWPPGIEHADSMAVYFVLSSTALRAYCALYGLRNDLLSLVLMIQALHRLRGKRFLTFKEIQGYTGTPEARLRSLIGDTVQMGYITASQVDKGRNTKRNNIQGARVPIQRLPAQYHVNSAGHSLIIGYLDYIQQIANGDITPTQDTIPAQYKEKKSKRKKK
jgi:hypothetical protein